MTQSASQPSDAMVAYMTKLLEEWWAPYVEPPTPDNPNPERISEALTKRVAYVFECNGVSIEEIQKDIQRNNEGGIGTGYYGEMLFLYDALRLLKSRTEYDVI